MNKRELKTLSQEAERAMWGSHVALVPDQPGCARIELPVNDINKKPLYFFVVRRSSDKKFSMVLPSESIGILAIQSTLAILQDILKTYGLILTQDAVIIEKNTALPLSKRIRTMAQTLIAIDGIRRLWKVEFNRRPDASESESIEPVRNATDNSTSR